MNNCRELLPGKLQVNWEIQGDWLQVQLIGKIKEDQYMAFGLSGNPNKWVKNIINTRNKCILQCNRYPSYLFSSKIIDLIHRLVSTISKLLSILCQLTDTYRTVFPLRPKKNIYIPYFSLVLNICQPPIALT